tara:strand:+ start:1920 stop:2111 length:192 start_codon:yes stop_codon:yes gene_type:complete
MLISRKRVESFLKVANHAVIVKETGVTYPTLRRISNGGYDHARYSTREKLSQFIREVMTGVYK